MRSRVFRFGFVMALLGNQSAVAATPNYHLVGWVNTFVPGGGAYLLGDYGMGALETTTELSAFYIGYHNSARVPMTLDGVPEDLPSAVTTLKTTHGTAQVCVKGKNDKKNCYPVTTTSTTSITSTTAVDVTNSLYADWMQEFAIKYHFVNIFDSYRKAAGEEGLRGPQKIDQTSTGDLFLAPFYWQNLKSAWVFPAILVSAAALVISYHSSASSGTLDTISPLNQSSQRLYDATYLGVFPVGSAAPEEMFYRGFLQHEAYGLVPSPFFSIGLSTLAYSFSHSSNDRASAAITGAYSGLVTHAREGNLSEAIAYHFWADVLAGIYQIALVRKESGRKPLINFDLSF